MMDGTVPEIHKHILYQSNWKEKYNRWFCCDILISSSGCECNGIMNSDEYSKMIKTSLLGKNKLNLCTRPSWDEKRKCKHESEETGEIGGASGGQVLWHENGII